MAGKKYGFILYARTPAAYAAMSPTDRAKPGRAFEQTLKQYAGKVDLVRRYWTSAFTHESSDVFIFECNDPADAHAFQEEMDRALAKTAGGDPTRFGGVVHVTFGINPDAEAQTAAPRRRGGRGG